VRIFFLAIACAVACSQNEVMPPMLGDFDGSIPVPPGGSIGDGGGNVEAGEAGTVTTLAVASNPKGLFLASGYVYYTNYATGAADGSVSAVPTTGGAQADLATGLTAPWAITVGAGNAFFTQSPTSGTGGVYSVATTGGTPTPVMATTTGAVGIVSDGTNLYWTLDAGGGGTSIEMVALGGGTPKDILDIGGDITPTALTLSGTSLFIGTTGTQAAVLTGLTTGTGNLTELDTPTTVTMGDVVASATNVYVTVDDIAPNGAIVSYPRGTGSPQTIAASLNHPQRMALDGTNLYFTDPAGGNVWLVDLTTNTASIFASGLNAPLPIAVSDALYVGDADAIVRIAKL
jgi:hypothetical protein